LRSLLAEDRDGRCRWWAAILIVGLSLLRIVYLFCFSPYDLAPDEGHYFDWSRHLDWSYYSKGPLIAWIGRGSLELLGGWSMAIEGTQTAAARTPAVLFGGLILTSLYILTYQTFRNDRLALVAVLAGISLPMLTVCSLIATIDSPFLCCWSWALVFGHEAMLKKRRWAWLPTGVFILLGILAKYTMALWLFSAGLFLLFTPSLRYLLLSRGFWLMVFVAGLSAIPILWWNSRNDWVTFKHVAAQAGVPNAQHNNSIRWWGPLEYVGGQFGILLGYWFVAWVWGIVQYRPWKERNLATAYLWWMSIPTFVVFGISSIKASGQLNWPVSTYLSGLILGLAAIATQLESPLPKRRQWARWGLGLFLLGGLILSCFIYDTRRLTPILTPFIPAESSKNETPIRIVDPAARLKGWRYLAGEIDRIRSQITLEEGVAPEIAAIKWDYPGVLGIYCQGQPQVYCLGLVMGDRHSQYDLWRPNPLADAQDFEGKTFLFVGIGHPEEVLRKGFSSVSEPREIVYREGDWTMAKWSIWVCRGYRGFNIANPSNTPGH
jgi:hypothetical protein